MPNPELKIAFTCDIIEALHKRLSLFETFRAIRRLIDQNEMNLAEAIHIVFRQIINSQFIDDFTKAGLIDKLALQYRGILTKDGFIRIVQTDEPISDEAKGVDHSLIRDAIRNDLPLTFRALYFTSDCDESYFIDNRYELHSHLEIIDLMRGKSKFCSNDENGYGPGGKLTAKSITQDNAVCWLNTFDTARLALRELLYITHLSNVPSVLTEGILSHESAAAIAHKDVSDQAVQQRRDSIKLPNGKSLHEHANLYFDARNPMMYKLTHSDPTNPLCVLRISPVIPLLPNVIVTDRNAACNDAVFLPSTDISKLDRESIYAESWSEKHAQPAKRRRVEESEQDARYRKAAKCAEVLVPDRVKPKYILGAYVRHKQDKQILMSYGFFDDRDVAIKPKIFFSP